MKSINEIAEHQKEMFDKKVHESQLSEAKELYNCLLESYNVASRSQLSGPKQKELDGLVRKMIGEDNIVNEEGKRFLKDSNIILCESSTPETKSAYFDKHMRKHTNEIQSKLYDVFESHILNNFSTIINETKSDTIYDCISQNGVKEYIYRVVNEQIKQFVDDLSAKINEGAVK